MEEQTEISAVDGHSLDRLTLTDTDREVRDWFGEQLAVADLETRVTEMGYMFGRRSGTDLDAGTILRESHLDSQPHGGVYTASVTPEWMFAVSETGKSHALGEYTSWDDCYKAANTPANAALDLAGIADTTGGSGA